MDKEREDNIERSRRTTLLKGSSLHFSNGVFQGKGKTTKKERKKRRRGETAVFPEGGKTLRRQEYKAGLMKRDSNT